MRVFLFLLLAAMNIVYSQQQQVETKREKDMRMQWWRDARFGMFIHWGLYSIPAGEWKDGTGHAEWIRTTAEIPLEEYDKFVDQFNPINFDADSWVKMAKDAGMKYIVITSKHHDGFCLFDSEYTDFDVMSTPFSRDILIELADACRKYDLKMCFYHSIMDWHHPDYLPRRTWETNRSTEGADFNRFIKYLKNQLKEIITNYGDIGVLWFDGEWEDTWTKELGEDLYNYVRSLDKNIIVNNRVSKGRTGMEGLTIEGEGAGDFGTPEQQIPATGLPGIDWESCLTMNDNWGYNKHDKNFKSTKDLIQMIADIASKGGNLLLNIGPKSDGTFPQESIDRLREIGNWMKINGEAIYATQASPFKSLSWGRCTQKSITDGARLYLHVFNYPVNGKLFLPGITNLPLTSSLMADKTELVTEKIENGIIVNLPPEVPDSNNTVVALDIEGIADVITAPVIESEYNLFIDELEVNILSENKDLEIRYSLDGKIPTSSSPLFISPITITNSCTLNTALFKDGRMLSEISNAQFEKVEAKESVNIENPNQGIAYKYFEGDWNILPDFTGLKSVDEGIINNFSLENKKVTDKYGFEFSGYINIPEDGIYTFYLESDDGSKLYLDDKLLIDNDNLHGMIERKGIIALKSGFHLIHINYFESTGEDDLIVSIKIPGKEKQLIPDSYLFH